MYSYMNLGVVFTDVKIRLLYHFNFLIKPFWDREHGMRSMGVERGCVVYSIMFL